MWIIGFAEGGFVGCWSSEKAALAYRDMNYRDRVANVIPLTIVVA